MDNKEEILKMVKDGVISVEEAARLLEAMEVKKDELIRPEVPMTLSDDYKRKMLRIYVEAAEGDVVKVNIPVAIVLAGIDIAKKFNDVKLNNRDFDMSQIDFDMIKECIRSGMVGEIVNVESSNGDIVRIVIE